MLADGRASAPRASVARLLPLGASSRRLTLTESFVDDDARVETFLDECEARADARGGGLWDVLPTRARAALGPEATDDARASASASEEALRVDADARGRLRLARFVATAVERGLGAARTRARARSRGGSEDGSETRRSATDSRLDEAASVLASCKTRLREFLGTRAGDAVVARVLHLESALGNGRNAPRTFWKSRVLFIHQVLRESASLSTRSVAVHALYRALEDICEEDSLFCAPHDADAETVIKEILDSDEFNDWCHADEIRALDPSPSPFVEAGKGGALANLRRVWLMRRMLGMPEIERFKARTLDAARTLFSVFVGEDDLFERFTRYWIRVHARGEDVRERRLDSWSVDVDVDAARLWLTCCAEQFGDHAEQAKIWGIDYIHQ